ncbi:hypothetical protein ASG90_12065 [Nocardioides sp. Soil797]|nr:hypothetical protein ASG90_12065 [Nocardioides sp. Soil797]
MCLVGACDGGESSDGEAGLDTDKVARVLTRAADDPSRARRLLSGRAEGDLATEAQDAGIPTEDVVSWLLEDHGFPGETSQAVADVLKIAAQPAAGSQDEAVTAQVVASPQVDPVLRPAVAGLLVDHVPEMMASVSTGEPWSRVDLARLLAEVGGDPKTRVTLTTAITDRAESRISSGELGKDAATAQVVLPTGWLVGAVDAGAMDGLDDGETRSLVDDRRLELETLAENSALAAGQSDVQARAMSAEISGAYSEGLGATG